MRSISNTTGSNNTANGFQALHSNTTGNDNTANGADALFNNTTGSNNTANGSDALFSNTTGSTTRPSVVMRSLTTQPAATTSHWALMPASISPRAITISISATVGVAGEANTIRIGTQGTQTATFIAGISGATVAEASGSS